MRFGVFAALIAALVARPAEAQSSPPAAPRSDRVLSETAPEGEQAAAHDHFERALTWYRAGKYHNAIGELEAALARDARGKDLVFNLALVQEKLGDLEGAIGSLERFEELEKDPLELDRAEQTIHRLRGARAELLMRGHALLLAAPPLPCPVPRSRGQFDAWVIGSGSLAIASWLVGTVFAVRALALESDSDRREAAVAAELSLATSVLASAGTLALYFGRYSDLPARGPTVPLAAPQATGARFEFRY